jgi:murein DD-endopeptidase MepM/ murein hydrolase activator NlpD
MSKDIDSDTTTRVVETCHSCGQALKGPGRFVLVRGRRSRSHCSEECLSKHVRLVRRAQRAARLRQLKVSLAMLPLVTAGVAWRLHRSPLPQSIVLPPIASTIPVEEPAAPQMGPLWPPTEEDWLAEFARAAWVYPLPGPVRRVASPDGHIFGVERPSAPAAQCHAGHCGVDLGGEIWGEHVYAVRDGVVDRVYRGSSDEHGGISVRLSHWGGMVFTQYFHLAAIPRRITTGAHVRAGEVIGLVGDSGVKGTDARPHLYFALSTRAASYLPESYVDALPLLSHWTAHAESQGGVTGLVAMAGAGHATSRLTARRHPHPAAPKKDAPAAESPSDEAAPASTSD